MGNVIGSKWETNRGLELRNIKLDNCYYLHNCGICSKALWHFSSFICSRDSMDELTQYRVDP